MIAEQSTSSVVLLDAAQPIAEIVMTVRMEIPQTGALAGSDVSIRLRYESELPEQLRDELHRGLYDGVHTGLAIISRPIPQGGIAVEVTRLVIKTPQLETIVADNSIKQVATSLHSLVAYTVASLWQSLNTWGDAPGT